MSARFHGSEYDPARDGQRLLSQQDRVREFLLSMTKRGQWMTVPEVASAIGAANHSSVERQIRYLKQEIHGAYRVSRRKRDGSGLAEFQVKPPQETLQLTLESAG